MFTRPAVTTGAEMVRGSIARAAYAGARQGRSGLKRIVRLPRNRCIWVEANAGAAPLHLAKESQVH